MPKNVFWPATLVVMGFIFFASNLGLLPAAFWNFWPLILIVVGLGGLLTSDREEWMVDLNPSAGKTRKTGTSSRKKKSVKKTKTASRKRKVTAKRKK